MGTSLYGYIVANIIPKYVYIGVNIIPRYCHILYQYYSTGVWHVKTSAICEASEVNHSETYFPLITIPWNYSKNIIPVAHIPP